MFLAVRFDFKSFLVCFSYLIHHYVVKFYTPCLCLWFYKIWSKFTVWFLGFFTCSLCSRQDSKKKISSDLYSLFSMHWSFFWALDFKLGSQTHIVRLSPIGLRVHTKSFRKENLHFYVSKKCLSNVALRKKTHYTDFLSFISFPFLVFTKHDPCFFN
jgi:hypothetical protein